MEIDQKTRDWLDEVSKRSREKIEQSDLFASVVTKNFVDDPVCALQIGYAVLMDKPILLVVDKSVSISSSLVKIAKLIERVDIKDEKDLDRAMNSIRDYAGRMK